MFCLHPPHNISFFNLSTFKMSYLMSAILIVKALLWKKKSCDVNWMLNPHISVNSKREMNLFFHSLNITDCQCTPFIKGGELNYRRRLLQQG